MSSPVGVAMVGPARVALGVSAGVSVETLPMSSKQVLRHPICSD
eukprot:CAMPEP_0183386250 /NCGR_PEP_ID=MMETSP0370-20130417/2165_1 /TAXON_ID=268820 /ORGANISM="Peridinium aciculiferum, Strain PAER-2" /LENGTH=43 /DNA_ID= /DNA_START= /DNA_END= /DNA_ORIENTATION=